MVCTDCGKLRDEAACSCGGVAVAIAYEDSLKRCPLKVRARLAIAESRVDKLVGSLTAAKSSDTDDAKLIKALRDRIGVLKGKIQRLKKRAKK